MMHSWHPEEVLIADRELVRAAQLPDIEKQMTDWVATVDDVRTWYFTHDPVTEEQDDAGVRMMALSGSQIDDVAFKDLEDRTYEAMVNESAALTLITSVVDPDILRDHPTTWTQVYRETVPLLRDTPLGGPEFLIPSLLAKIPANLNEQQFTDLYMALDSLHASSNCYVNQATRVQRIIDHGNEELNTTIFQRQAQLKGTAYFAESMALALALMEQGMNSASPEIRKMALKAGMFGFASMTERRVAQDRAHKTTKTAETVWQTTHDSVKNYAHLINNYFIENGDSNVRVIKGSAKGDLHEAVYLLDLAFLLATNQDKYPNWHAKPVFPRLDSPKVGYPKIRRGVDITVNNGDRNMLIQLKSGSSGDDVAYHPRILPLREKNFQDVDKRRLSAKLQRYIDWGDSGFNPTDTDKIKRYLLPTAVETLDHIERMANMDRVDYMLGSLIVNDLTRAEKRRIARRLGAFSSRKSQPGK